MCHIHKDWNLFLNTLNISEVFWSFNFLFLLPFPPCPFLKSPRLNYYPTRSDEFDRKQDNCVWLFLFLESLHPDFSPHIWKIICSPDFIHGHALSWNAVTYRKQLLPVMDIYQHYSSWKSSMHRRGPCLHMIIHDHYTWCCHVFKMNLGSYCHLNRIILV